MKTVFVLISSLLLSASVFAAGDNCYQISNQDSKNYCLGTAKQDKSYCYQISETDRKNMCLAIAGRDKTPCYQISSTEKKNMCLGQF